MCAPIGQPHLSGEVGADHFRLPFHRRSWTLSAPFRTSRKSDERLIERIVNNGEKIRRKKASLARKEAKLQGETKQDHQLRALDKEEKALATWIFVRALRSGVHFPYSVERDVLAADAEVLALAPRKRPLRRWMSDALFDLRCAVPAWGEVRSGGVRMELSYLRLEGCDQACIESFHGHGMNVDAVSDATTLGELKRLSGGDPDRIHEAVARWWWREASKRAVALVLVAAMTVGCAWGVWKLVKLVKDFSRIIHIEPALPKNLGGGIVIESATPLDGEAEYTPSTEGTFTTGMLLWKRAGVVTVAPKSDRMKFLRKAPDSDVVWTWTATIRGVPFTYDTTAPAIRVSGAGTGTLEFAVFPTEKYNRAAQVAVDEDGIYGGPDRTPVDDHILTDGYASMSRPAAPIDRLQKLPLPVYCREKWRPPLIRYACDGTMACTFTLAPGPWHPCWQRVEVDFGDGTVTDTRRGTPGVLSSIKGPLFSGDWDAVMLRAQHQYAKPGTYPLRFCIKPADTTGYSGPCEPGPPPDQKPRLRTVIRSLELAPGASGVYPTDAQLVELTPPPLVTTPQPSSRSGT